MVSGAALLAPPTIINPKESRNLDLRIYVIKLSFLLFSGAGFSSWCPYAVRGELIGAEHVRIDGARRRALQAGRMPWGVMEKDG